MSSFQWFCLALRIIGAWNFVVGLEHFTSCFNAMHGYYNPTLTHPFGFFIQGSVHLVVALVLLRLAPFLALFAYPTPRPRPEQTEGDNAADV
jgi:hypothetical protein